MQGGKRVPKGCALEEAPTEHVYIRVTDMKDGSISDEDLRYISAEVRQSIARYTIDKEDLDVTIAGTIGEVGRVPERFDGQNLTENAAKIVFREIDADFLQMMLSSTVVQRQFEDKTKQTAQPKLALKRIRGASLLVPPPAEQQRIVARYRYIADLCEALRFSLSATLALALASLDAALRMSLDPASPP